MSAVRSMLVFCDLLRDRAERRPDDLLVRPAGAKHHGDRAVLAVSGEQLRDGLVDRVN